MKEDRTDDGPTLLGYLLKLPKEALSKAASTVRTLHDRLVYPDPGATVISELALCRTGRVIIAQRVRAPNLLTERRRDLSVEESPC